MILDQYGKPIGSPLFAPEAMVVLNRRVLESVKHSLVLVDQIRGRVLDHRGEPVFSRVAKVGSTIHVQRPFRFVGRTPAQPPDGGGASNS